MVVFYYDWAKLHLILSVNLKRIPDDSGIQIHNIHSSNTIKFILVSH